MTGKYGDLDYSRLTKLSFLLGLGLFVVSEFGLRTVGRPGPAWQHRLLITAALVGILVALLSPFVFGIVLPLTE